MKELISDVSTHLVFIFGLIIVVIFSTIEVISLATIGMIIIILAIINGSANEDYLIIRTVKRLLNKIK